MSHNDVTFDDYVRDTRELSEHAASIIEDLRRQVRDREVLMWAMVRAAGGTVLVSNGDLARGYPEAFRIDEDADAHGRRFTIVKP